MRLHVTGACGSGTSTLGRALAMELGAAFIEADDIFWQPSDPPFQIIRPAWQRCALLLTAFARHPASVVSGSVYAWGPEVEDAFDGIVFLYVDTALRVQRLRAREQALYGKVIPEFIEWAAQYDTGPPRGRSLARQRAWLAARSCPVLRLEGDMSTGQRLAHIRQWLQAPGGPRVPARP
ncbi:hypothetical protein [Comamonas endophytica]|uniref:Adenylate kinase family enzyme n=1 Tax=Comamonas endophytica TaxID=2949090 RepID=A0ABY6GFU8_9BURK|nr:MULTISPECIES: hypothetical protein [unclassified Acidovorax]MCD2514434.1 hypothetical protein [Acidovorax sp. D4N7]UYG53723.1 hypothetical protein M9799_17460 [Acidovorax sp. 5MLIR]